MTRALPAFESAAEDYHSRLRGHLLKVKEDRAEFPLVDALLTPDTRSTLSLATERADSVRPEGLHERITAQAEALAQRLHASA